MLYKVIIDGQYQNCFETLKEANDYMEAMTIQGYDVAIQSDEA